MPCRPLRRRNPQNRVCGKRKGCGGKNKNDADVFRAGFVPQSSVPAAPGSLSWPNSPFINPQRRGWRRRPKFPLGEEDGRGGAKPSRNSQIPSFRGTPRESGVAPGAAELRRPKSRAEPPFAPGGEGAGGSKRWNSAPMTPKRPQKIFLKK